MTKGDRIVITLAIIVMAITSFILLNGMVQAIRLQTSLSTKCQFLLEQQDEAYKEC